MDQGDLPMKVIREGEAARVKPAEETEKGIYFLSNLDHMSPVITKTVYFYQASPTKGNKEAVEVVRDSLGKLLVPYHPMAGRLAISQEGKYVVELTGEGAAFAVADANFEVGEFLAAAPHPPKTLLKLVYYVEGANILESPLLTVQVTKFKCGGFAVGVCMNHCLCDGPSAIEFFNSWGHVARHGLPVPAPPVLDRSILKARDPPRPEFPHIEFREIDEVSGLGDIYDEPIESRAFVFDEERIGRLKGKAM